MELKIPEEITHDFKFKIYPDTHPILHQMSEDISPDTFKDNQEFLRRMFSFMRERGGVGLAAPQVGLPYKFFIMHAPGDRPRVCINPYIEANSEETEVQREGCLTYPGLYLSVRRSQCSIVAYNDEHGNTINDRLFDFTARVFQHEYDHVKGITFTDKVSDLKLKMAKKKVKQNLKKLKKAGRIVD